MAIKYSVLTIYLVLCICFHLSAQKKDGLTDSIKPELKVNSLSGLMLKLESPCVAGYGLGRNMPFFLNYINESRITPSTTILLRAGVTITPGVFYEDTISNDYMPDLKTGNKVTYCSFGFNFGVEPRWYWNYKKRAQKGKIKLNSGWFLSLPLEISLPLHTMISTPTTYHDYTDQKWITDYFNLFYSLGISVGYRHALSNNWLLEGSFETQAMGDLAKYRQYNSLSTVAITPQINIKVLYIFKEHLD